MNDRAQVADLQRRIQRTLDYTDELLQGPLDATAQMIASAVRSSLCTPPPKTPVRLFVLGDCQVAWGVTRERARQLWRAGRIAAPDFVVGGDWPLWLELPARPEPINRKGVPLGPSKLPEGNRRAAERAAAAKSLGTGGAE